MASWGCVDLKQVETLAARLAHPIMRPLRTCGGLGERAEGRLRRGGGSGGREGGGRTG